MEPTIRKKKPAYLFWILLLPLCLYCGYSLGKVDYELLSLENINQLILDSLKAPLPVVISPHTKQLLFLSVIIWFVAFLFYLSKLGNYMPGQEHGTAKFEDPKEINRKIADKDTKKNKILSESLRMSMDTRKTRLNNNVLIIGGAGTGKSMFTVTPNLFQSLSSYILTDPKGELLRDNGEWLKAQGYNIKVLNLVQMENSDGYNPFKYVRSETDVIKLITNLIANTTPKNAIKGDPFWEKSESMYLQSLFLYVWIEYPKQEKPANFRGLMELLNKAEIPEDEGEESELDRLMYCLDAKHPALLAYNKVRRGAADTVRSIIISANARLAYLENPEILRILDKDEMDIPFLGTGVRKDPDKKTALFCVIPDSDKSYNFVVGCLYTQVFQELYYQADFVYGGRLPVPVMFWMDEFANIALPEDFCSLLSTMRSREISCNIIIQNLAQIKALFDKTWETVPGNCDTLIYLGGNEKETHKYISESLGKWTVDKRSRGESLGKNGSSSRNYDVLGRELMTPDEVRKMPNEKCIVFVRGMDPVYDWKYKTFEKSEFKEAREYGPYQYKNRKNFAQEKKEKPAMEDLEILSEKELEYYKELAKDEQSIAILSLAEAELLGLDTKGISETQPTEEELGEIMNNESYKKVLHDAAEEDEKLRKECEELESELNDSQGISKGWLGQSLNHIEEIISKNKYRDLAGRLITGKYSVEQIEEAETGLNNGLPEEMILLYFVPEYSAEYMRQLRLLAECASYRNKGV